MVITDKIKLMITIKYFRQQDLSLKPGQLVPMGGGTPKQKNPVSLYNIIKRAITLTVVVNQRQTNLKKSLFPNHHVLYSIY